MNKKRVLAAIPTPPSYDLNKILSNIFVLESEKRMIQGTCFNVENIDLVTCSHTLADDLILYQASNPTKGHTVKIISSDEVIDIARIEVEGISLEKGLSLGMADNLNHMDHIAIAGFPN